MDLFCDGNRPVPGGFAPRVRKRMAGLDPLHACRQIGVRMRADGDCLPDRQVRRRGKRRGHRSCRLADRDDVKSPRGQNLGDIVIGKRARQHATRTDCFDTRADDVLEILPEAGNGDRQ